MKFCYGHMSNPRVESGLLSVVWYNGVPLKFQFFMWIALLDKISTMDSLWKKGFHFPIVRFESSSHLLIHCPFS